MTSEDLKKVVEERLAGRSKCYGHCQEQTALRLLPEGRTMVGCYVCPSGYVSRIVAYGKEIDVMEFKDLLSEIVQDIGDIADGDIRVATRYTWDLGIEEETDGAVLREAYWTQNYGGTKSDDPNRMALFLCTRCSSFYHQPVSERNTLCPKCRVPLS